MASNAQTRLIPLSRDFVAVVDLDDYVRVTAYIWYAGERRGLTYAFTDSLGKSTAMHRFLLDVGKGIEVDHIDGNGLNNTRSNLRIATHRQNLQNRRPTAGRYTYKGVSYHDHSSLYRARITVNGKQLNLGYFKCSIEAAQAYDKAAKEHFGEFARTNF